MKASFGLSHSLIAQAGLVAAIATMAPNAYAADRYSAFVIDTQTHEVLFDEAADEQRYPASLTKMMTLYMLFDELEKGDIHLSDRMKVSRHAARQAPTKLGLRVGRTITVEEAIKGICTKSANDAAVVIAERLGGTESGFAAKMTTKARQIGMAHTTFVNASGLPDARQVTTARDIAVLSERLIEDFPQYYHYFQTAGMTWGKRYIANHNHLIGEVEGVDGIKTGYTNASGYNLASAVLRHGTRIVAVVMGGETAAARDAQMTYLIENAYDELDARSTSQTATLTGMPITKATVDFTNGTVRTQTAGQDRVQYSAPAPSTASLISGSSIAAAPIAGAPVSAGASMIDQIADSKGLF